MPRAGLSPHRLAIAGAEVADASGLDQLTISQVARHLGVKPPSLYSHITGSADLHALVTRLCLDELADEAAQAVAGRSAHEALRAYADVLRGYAGRHPGRYAATRRTGRLTDAELTAGRRHSELWAAVLRGYRLPPTETVHATRLLGGTLHGFITLEAAGSFDHSAPSAEESWTRVVDVLDHTLRSWPEA